MGSRIFLYVAVCTGNLAAIAVGICFGWTSPVLPKLKGYLEEPITEEEASWIGSLLAIAAMISPLISGYTADKFGRKKTLIFSVIPMAVGFLLAAFGKRLIYFYATRILFGLSAGVMFMILPIYIGEISDNEVRGSVGSLMQVFTALGVLLAFSVGSFVSIFTFNIFCFFMPVLFIISFSFIPESPYYLVATNKLSEAEKSLSRFRSEPRNFVQKELCEIKANVDEALKNKGSLKDILSHGNLKAMFLSLSLMFFQQTAGINVINFYSQDVFAASGSSLSPVISSIIIGLIQLFSSFITPILADRLGRRILLMFSGAGSGLSLFTLGYYFYVVEQENQKETSGFFALLPVISLIVYIITYCTGYGCLPWAIVGEVFPSNVKAMASSIIVSFCLLLAFLTTKLFKPVTEAFGTSVAFWIFSGCALFGGVFVFIFLPETKGKSLQEIQDLLNGRKDKNTEVLTELKPNSES